jgi:hypothetical protein
LINPRILTDLFQWPKEHKRFVPIFINSNVTFKKVQPYIIMGLVNPQYKFRNEYFVFLLPFFFISHYYVVYYPNLPLRLFAVLFAQYAVVIIVMNALLTLLLKSWQKSSLATCFLLCLQFFVIPIAEILSSKFHSNIEKVKYVMLLFSAFLFYFLILFLKKSSNLIKLVRFLNILFLTWITVEGFKLVRLTSYFTSQLQKHVNLQPCPNCIKPDIYLLVADEYAGTKQLTDIFNFDNADFISFLKKKSFHVIPNSRSYYNMTVFSVASLLSLDSLKILDPKKPQTKDYTLAGLEIQNSPVGLFLQNSGYDVSNLSIFNFLNKQPQFTHSHMVNFGQAFNMRTLTASIYKDINKRFFRTGASKDDRLTDLNYNKNTIDFLLKKISFTSGRPKFIYAHLLMPHSPYFFNEDGRLNPPAERNSESSYLGYLKYCNKQIEIVIKKIFESSKKPPIILLLSDHGYRGGPAAASKEYFFMNLSAIYLPDKNYGSLYDGISLPNQIRTVLNSQFGQTLPLIRDTTILLKE